MRRLYEKNYFLIKRLHSLLGIIPVGVFFLIHMFLNSRASQSPEQYQWVPNTLDEVPFIWVVEIFGILVPILFHAALGAVIVYQGDVNAHKPALSWYANWAYVLQRFTGVLLFVMIVWHVAQTWWVHTRVKLLNAFDNGSGGEFQIFNHMAGILANPLWLVLYALFVLLAAYHFGNGVYNFCYKWGITSNRRAQKYAIALGMLVAFIGTYLGFSSLWGLALSPWAKQMLAHITGGLVAGI